MNKYQVKDWVTHFENDRSKTRKQCSFVCVPNKQHGMGFCRIMAEPDGAAIYGIWHMIVGACSQQPCRNGWLTSNGEQTGSAWGVDDLALKFRRPVNEIERALTFLSSEKVEWLVFINEDEITHRALTAHSPSNDAARGVDGIEGRKEEKEEKECAGASKFVEPSIEEVKRHGVEIGLSPIECSKFFHYYGSNGWKVGKNKMKSWHQAIAGWKDRADSQSQGQLFTAPTPQKQKLRYIPDAV